MQAGGFYSSGKGFQKVGMICLLLEKFFTLQDVQTQECVGWLAGSFQCYYDPANGKHCLGASASYYDQDWGGLVDRIGWDKKDGNCDFGNVDYNDHHYHFGYFVVSAAILAKLKPDMLQQPLFVGYVNTLIRDTTNPSTDDLHFPRFRTFDWFDLHSWSHGIVPAFDGKDQESTSEELNLHYGLTLWGKVTGDEGVHRLGATMLTLAANTVREFFLMKTGNPYHPADFVKNHVTGIFLQGKVDYTTWFGRAPEFIHGIQMLPLSPALMLTRKPDFCKEEWDDILSKVDLDGIAKPWDSVLLTGSLAILDPELAYSKLRALGEGDMDGGLSRAWALYWAAVRPGELTPAAGQFSAAPRELTPVGNSTPAAGNSTPAAEATSTAAPRVAAEAASLLKVVGAGSAADASVFPPKKGHPNHSPDRTLLEAPVQTNKFWTNWAGSGGADLFPIFPMPYILSWGGSTGSHRLEVAHSSHVTMYSKAHPDRMKTYLSPNVPDLFLAAKESVLEAPVIVGEGLFGVHVEVASRGGAKISFPIFNGMAYISGNYSGGLTPLVSHEHGLEKQTKASPGIWSFFNRRHIEYRVYVLNHKVLLVDNTYEFDTAGRLNQQLDGWVRIARVLAEGDRKILDAHAEAVVVGCELDVSADGSGVHYKFQKVGPSSVKLLHLAYGHHLQLMGM
ncbi:unnamed protein product [Polarella glacialis]|uniref:glucan endo-1,3-beta-D-glucosidase n=1 Tax=Polarella glacialis TaxID=89957 RepID=A0A813J6J1_POLGL|nr:unnamed protein product [Polarella glacialis]